jgi:murein DD-endopeptidase MepM/ murein hydrolase activator NlpD
MIFPVREKYRITDGFNVQRGRHIHGAIDIAVPTGTLIHAPETGLVYYHWQWAKHKHKTHNLYWPHDGWYEFSNYFNQEFGCLIILHGDSGRSHVFAHIEPETIYNCVNFKNVSITHYEDSVAIFNGNLGEPVQVIEGDLIGVSGNHGKSTGPHIHYELHKNYKWIPHKKRENPEELYELKR